MNILVTGAEGFIGSRLVRALEKNHKVTALDYVKSGKPSNIPQGMPYVNADLSAGLENHEFSCPDLVMHFATVSIEVIDNQPQLEAVNMKAMLNVLEYCRIHKIPLVFASSCSVYGSGINHKETDPYDPKSLYAVGKMACEEYAKFYSKYYDFWVTILRYSNVYGDTTQLEDKVYPGKKDVVRIFMENAINNKPLPLIGGKQTRDFTFVDDAVEAACKVTNLKGLNIFNVATGVETPIAELASMMSNVLGKKTRTAQRATRPIDGISRRSLDISAISKIWKPSFSLEDGLKMYAQRMMRKD